MSNHLISVVLATRSLHAPWLQEALESIAFQTHRPLELILVAPDTVVPEWLSRWTLKANFMCKIIRSDKAEYVHQRNLGLLEAQGEYLCLIDDDDVYLFDKLELELERAKKDDAYVTYSPYFHADENLANTRLQRLSLFTYERLLQGCFITDYSLVKRDALMEVGLPDEMLGEMAMYDLWLRFAEKYPDRIAKQTTPTWIYRHHEGQMSSKRPQHVDVDVRRQVIEASRKRKALMRSS